jgi:hypothetical protein
MPLLSYSYIGSLFGANIFYSVVVTELEVTVTRVSWCNTLPLQTNPYKDHSPPTARRTVTLHNIMYNVQISVWIVDINLENFDFMSISILLLLLLLPKLNNGNIVESPLEDLLLP